MGNPQLVPAEAVKWHTQPYSVVVTLSPLSAIMLKRARLAGDAPAHNDDESKRPSLKADP